MRVDYIIMAVINCFICIVFIAKGAIETGQLSMLGVAVWIVLSSILPLARLLQDGE